MKNTSSGHPQLAKFHKLKSLIEKIPGVSKQGFSRVTDHIGKFSVGFASAPTQAFSVIERLSPDDNNLGLKQLQEDYSKIESETKAVLEGIDTLISDPSSRPSRRGLLRWSRRPCFRRSRTRSKARSAASWSAKPWVPLWTA
jgi:hypothetical protein